MIHLHSQSPELKIGSGKPYVEASGKASGSSLGFQRQCDCGASGSEQRDVEGKAFQSLSRAFC